jgi:hypothetical protein
MKAVEMATREYIRSPALTGSAQTIVPFNVVAGEMAELALHAYSSEASRHRIALRPSGNVERPASQYLLRVSERGQQKCADRVDER